MAHSTIKRLVAAQLIRGIPSFLAESIQYEVIMGSFAYGVSNDMSDIDLYGWCIPDKDMIFPHLKGEIEGFGRQKQRFEVWQQHHIEDSSKRAQDGTGSRVYDCQVYNIVKYFSLCMENNPNMIESLFVPRRCVVFSTPVAEVVRENRKITNN